MRKARLAWLRRFRCPAALRRLRLRRGGAAPADVRPDRVQLLEAIVEHMPAMVFVKDADELRFVLFNREAEDLLGISRHEILGKTDYDLFPEEQADFFTAKDREALEADAPLEIAVEEILSPTMGLRHLRTRKVAIRDETGRPRYLLGISADITELMRGKIGRLRAEEALARSEAFHRSLLEYSSDVTLVVDSSGVITYATPSAEHILGHAVADLRDADFLAIVHPDDRPEARRAFQGVLEDPTARPRVVVRVHDKAGRWRILESNATSAVADPAVAGVVVNSHEITEQVELQNQYMQAQRMEAVGNLAGGVAHDFNNLLAVITLNAALLLDELDQANPRRADVTAIIGAAQSAANLTRQLLAFSRRQILQPVLLDVAAVVREMEPLIRRVLGEDVVAEIVLRDGVHPAQVLIDRGQFEQVILNLSVNARQAMATGGMLTIRLSVEAAEVRLEVSDTGVGMSEETRARIFEPFFTTKPTGTGLGLATVYGIVKQSQGRIAVESEPGRGTVFRISLPRAEGTVDATETRTPTVGVPRARPDETVLVVDDQPEVRAAVRKFLSRLGYKVLEAADGEEGLQVATGLDRLDLLLTDIVMPRMRGTELADRLAAVRPGLPVIFTTGYGDSDKGIELPPTMRVLTKPFELAALARAVRDAIDSREAPRRSEEPT